MVHSSYFFRDSFVQDYIYENFYDKSNIKVVSLGCSSGEEIYSYAMMLDDMDNIEFLGIDCNKKCIQDAQRGAYPIKYSTTERFLFDSRYIKTDWQKKAHEKFQKYFSAGYIGKTLARQGFIRYQKQEGAFQNCNFEEGSILDIDTKFRKTVLIYF